ncbi:dihydroorotase [bacterium]|nr:dihydroorotase [bacterium]
MKLLIKNGTVIDPSQNMVERTDIFIENNKICKLGKNINEKDCKILNAMGMIVSPGFIDMHAHLREPGREDAETIAAGTTSAAKGGFTSVCCMPNTEPAIDNQSVVKFVLEKAKKEGKVNVFPIGAITKARKGAELAEIGDMKDAGIVAVSDDGNWVENAALMRRALEYSEMFNILVISHCEDRSLSEKGVMNEGYASTVLGLEGIPRESEEIAVFRDISLAKMLNAGIHIAHVSSRGTVKLIREAKSRKIKVSCEVTPNHFALTEQAVKGYDAKTKVNPPLRSEDDIKAVKNGLADGTIDVIATDHAPHTVTEKEYEYNNAPFGIVGFETAVGLAFTELVHSGVLSLSQLIEKLSCNPAKILGFETKGTLKIGADADITIINENKEWTVDINKFLSKSKNSPYHNRKLKGKVIATIVGGKIVCKD